MAAERGFTLTRARAAELATATQPPAVGDPPGLAQPTTAQPLMPDAGAYSPCAGYLIPPEPWDVNALRYDGGIPPDSEDSSSRPEGTPPPGDPAGIGNTFARYRRDIYNPMDPIHDVPGAHIYILSYIFCLSPQLIHCEL